MARNNSLNCEKSEGEDHGRVELAGAEIGEEGLTSRSRHQGAPPVREREGKEKNRGRVAPAGLLPRMRVGRGWADFGLVRLGWLSPLFFVPFLFLISFTDFEIELHFDSNKFCKICKNQNN